MFFLSFFLILVSPFPPYNDLPSPSQMTEGGGGVELRRNLSKHYPYGHLVTQLWLLHLIFYWIYVIESFHCCLLLEQVIDNNSLVYFVFNG